MFTTNIFLITAGYKSDGRITCETILFLLRFTISASQDTQQPVMGISNSIRPVRLHQKELNAISGLRNINLTTVKCVIGVGCVFGRHTSYTEGI